MGSRVAGATQVRSVTHVRDRVSPLAVHAAPQVWRGCGAVMNASKWRSTVRGQSDWLGSDRFGGARFVNVITCFTCLNVIFMLPKRKRENISYMPSFAIIE